MARLEFCEVVRKRRCVHSFTADEVSDEDLDYILEAARWAPSAGNSQPWRFVIVRKPENIQKVWESTTGMRFAVSSRKSIDITPQNFVKKAPVVIVVCTDTAAYRGRWSSIKESLFCIQDSAASTMNLLLAACDRGLGACWVGMFREDKLRDALNVPPDMRPVAIITIGHTKAKKKPPQRKPLQELVHYETFRND